MTESSELKPANPLLNLQAKFQHLEVYEMVRILIGLFIAALMVTNASAIEMPLVGIDGKNSNLSDFQGNWVVVNYWATWCPPCIEEMPELQAFHDDNVDKGAMVIGINTELVSKQQLESFLDKLSITFPIFRSRPEQKSELGLIPGLPTTFLVTPKGEVVARQIGPVTREMLEKFIQKREAQ